MPTDEKPVQSCADTAPLLSQERHDIRNHAGMSGLLPDRGEGRRKAQMHEAMFPPDVEHAVKDAIERTVSHLLHPPVDVTEQENWVMKRVYLYARRLKMIKVVRELKASDPRVWELGKRWERACTQSDLSVHGDDFVPMLLVQAWERALSADPREAKKAMFERARTQPLPEWLGAFPTQVKATAALCMAMEMSFGGAGKSFYLSCRTLMEFFGYVKLPSGDPKYANRTLKFLCTIGFLEPLTRGDSVPGAKPSKFRILWRESSNAT